MVWAVVVFGREVARGILDSFEILRVGIIATAHTIIVYDKSQEIFGKARSLFCAS